MFITPRELGTILGALRVLQQRGCIVPKEIEPIVTNDGEFVGLDENEVDELCEKLNCGRFLDLNSGAILVAINTQQDGEQSYNIGSAIPPEGADPHNNYGLYELMFEWRETGPEEPESDSAFVEWLIEDKGCDRLGNVDSVVINV